VRPAVLLALLGGCSSLLGIETPQPRDDGGTDADDAAVDAPDDTAPAQDRLEFSVASLRLARTQIARLRVQFIHLDGATEDVTATASYSSDQTAIATADQGRILAGQAGAAVITASQGNAAPARLTVTVAPEQCHPVINELQTAGGAGPNDEWVEIYNPCSDAIDVAGWTLDYRAATTTGATDDVLMVTLAGQLEPGDIRLFAGPAFAGNRDGGWTTGVLGGTNGAVGLRAGAISSGTLVDAIAYGNALAGHPFIEGNPAPAMMSGRSGARLPFDGKDDGDGAADISIVTTPTPRALNAP
jgi:hypothetical protein